MNVYIDNNRNLFDGETCDVSGMVKCELKKDGTLYEFYNIDGTPDLKKIQSHNTEMLKYEINFAIQNLLNTTAKSLKYDDINSIGKYIGYDNPFRLECESLGLWAANCWVKASELETYYIKNGNIPTSDDIISKLPKFN